MADPLEDKILAADRGELPPELPAPGAAGAPGGAAPDPAALWINAAIRYGAIARELLPEKVRPAWTEERLRALGVELASCAAHYGWEFGALLNHPLARLAVVSFPLAWPLIEPYAVLYMAGATPKPDAPAEPPAPPGPAAPAIVTLKPFPE